MHRFLIMVEETEWRREMKKPFTIAAVVIFSLAALMQLLRFSFAWEITVNGRTVPVWVSGIAFVIAAGLAVMVWREMRK
jgi:uncharacterized membrane protein